MPGYSRCALRHRAGTRAFFIAALIALCVLTFLPAPAGAATPQVDALQQMLPTLQDR